MSVQLIQESDRQRIQLPARKSITLCEAVTAYSCGTAFDAGEWMLTTEVPTIAEELIGKAEQLTERLQIAAYAGSIRFRALKNGEQYIDGHKEIDPLYFCDKRGFAWHCDQIWSAPQSAYPKLLRKARPPNFTMDWHGVHVDRDDFEALLRNLGVSVQEGTDAGALGKRKVFSTGCAGRPGSIHLILPMAQSRLDSRDYPETFKKFAEQLAEALAMNEPSAPPVTAKTLTNNPKLRALWRHRKPPKIIVRS